MVIVWFMSLSKNKIGAYWSLQQFLPQNCGLLDQPAHPVAIFIKKLPRGCLIQLQELEVEQSWVHIHWLIEVFGEHKYHAVGFVMVLLNRNQSISCFFTISVIYFYPWTEVNVIYTSDCRSCKSLGLPWFWNRLIGQMFYKDNKKMCLNYIWKPTD